MNQPEHRTTGRRIGQACVIYKVRCRSGHLTAIIDAYNAGVIPMVGWYDITADVPADDDWEHHGDAFHFRPDEPPAPDNPAVERPPGTCQCGHLVQHHTEPVRRGDAVDASFEAAPRCRVFLCGCGAWGRHAESDSADAGPVP